MHVDIGAKQRMSILRADAERKILEPLRTHHWQAAIEAELGEYLTIVAERGGHTHRIALLYSSATDNRVYKLLAGQVEHIFFNGAPYRVSEFAYGLDKPVSSADDFHHLLLEWNRISAEGKFVPARPGAESIEAHAPDYRLLLTEEPLEAIWLRIRQLQSTTLAQKLIARRAQASGVALAPDILRSKAEGVAFALRNASDSFQAPRGLPIASALQISITGA
jgi:hypothetical protein